MNLIIGELELLEAKAGMSAVANAPRRNEESIAK